MVLDGWDIWLNTATASVRSRLTFCCEEHWFDKDHQQLYREFAARHEYRCSACHADLEGMLFWDREHSMG